MKLIHLSDLHLGLRLNEFPMLEDQEFILRQILDIVDRQSPDAVLLAGDLYDKALPPTEAVELLDRFLCELARRRLRLFAISGNHDSPERVAFGGRLMEASGVFLSPVYDGTLQPVSWEDAFGTVNVYRLPFLKPAHVRRFFPDASIESYTDALRVALSSVELDRSARNILIAHQFVTGASKSDSETLVVGGSDNVDAEVFSAFDYVALGHLHRPQSLQNGRIRYCGAPLKYSFSEAGHEKSVTVVTLEQKNRPLVETIPLRPLRELRELRGSFATFCDPAFYRESSYPDEYLHITLTDEDDPPDALARLRSIYPYIMKLDYDNRRTRAEKADLLVEEAESLSPLAAFALLYEKQNLAPLDGEQRRFLKELIEEIWEDTP